jgi:hypothetical protein
MLSRGRRILAPNFDYESDPLERARQKASSERFETGASVIILTSRPSHSDNFRMDGNDLRARIDKLGLTYRAAAPRLGLSLSGLHHQMRGEAKVTRRTEMLLEQLEEQRQRFVYPSSNGLEARHRYAAPAPAPAGKTITNVELRAARSRAELNYLDDFARLYPADAAEFKRLVRPLRLRVSQRLEGSEIRQFEEIRRDRKAKLTVVADEPE